MWLLFPKVFLTLQVLFILACVFSHAALSPPAAYNSLSATTPSEWATFSEQSTTQEDSTYVYYDLYTDHRCTTSTVSVLMRNTTCTSTRYCNSNVMFGHYGYVFCPGSNPPPPRPGQVQALQFNNGTTCQGQRDIVTYYPKNVCTLDLFVTAMYGYSGKANCSQYTSFQGNSCSADLLYKQIHYDGGSGSTNCNSNEFGSGHSLTCNNENSDPMLNGYISYELFSDPACTIKTGSTLIRPSQVCVPNGQCVQLSIYVFGIAKCVSNLPAPQPGQMAISYYNYYNCSPQLLSSVEYHPLYTCSLSPTYDRVMSTSCSSFDTFNEPDKQCRTGYRPLNYSSRSCFDIPTGFSLGFSSNCEQKSVSCWNVDAMGPSTPVIDSTVIGNNAIAFTMNVSKDDNVKLEYYMYFGQSEFNFTTCEVVGNERMNFSIYTSPSPCTESFSTPPYLLDSLISSNLTTKTYLGDHMILNIPISIHIVDTRVARNGGFCKNYKYTTLQVLDVQLSPAISISNFNQTTPVHGYLTNMYPIEFSTSNDGHLMIQLIFEATNVSLSSLEFFNSTNSLFTLVVMETQFLYQVAATGKIYYQVVLTSDKIASDYRGLVFFKAIWKKKGVLDTLTEYLPLQIAYTIITPPIQKNITLESKMSLANNNWTPKTKFLSDERVFAQVLVTTALGDNSRIRVKDAFMCCFKQFTASITFNPSLGQYGCSRFNSSTMDVWTAVIANSIPDTQVETLTYQFGGNNFFGFSFKLLSKLFPEKYSQQSTSCFLQAHVETTPNTATNSMEKKRNNFDTEAAGVTSSLFVVDVMNTMPKTVSFATRREMNLVLSVILSIIITIFNIVG